MPRFFVDFRDGDNFYKDEQGIDVADFEQARNEAIALLPQVAKDQLPDGEHHEFVATIRDEGDVMIYRASLTFHGDRLA